jgi:hypothetical protein
MSEEKFKKQHERIHELRDQLSDIRHEFRMMAKTNYLHKDFLEPVAGGIECAIVTAYSAAEEMEQHYNKWPESYEQEQTNECKIS